MSKVLPGCAHVLQLALILTIVWPPRALSRPAPRTAPFPIMLAHPLRYQQIDKASCEAASAHIALAMSGVEVPERQLIAELPVDGRRAIYGAHGAVLRWGDPYRAFVGDITHSDEWPVVGYGVYVPPILQLLQRHGMDGSYGGPSMTAQELRQAIDEGHPVIAWVPKLSLYKYKETFQRRYWDAWDGRRIPWNEFEHAQVVVGYDSTGFYLDNPDYRHYSDGQWLWHYSWAAFQAGWDVLGDQAIVVARRAVQPGPSPTATATMTPRPTLTPTPPATPTRLATPRPTSTAGLPVRVPTFPPLPTPPPSVGTEPAGRSQHRQGQLEREARRAFAG